VFAPSGFEFRNGAKFSYIILLLFLLEGK